MAHLVRQTRAQTCKNLIIHLKRHWFTTFFRAFLLPVIFIAFISFARYLFVRPANYGIGSPSPVLSLREAMQRNSGPLVFVRKNGGSDVDQVVENVRSMIDGVGEVRVLENEDELRTECRQSLNGVSPCFAAVVWEDSPDASNSGRWKYTLRGDGQYTSGRFDAEEHDNDVQEYVTTTREELLFVGRDYADVRTGCIFRCSKRWIWRLRREATTHRRGLRWMSLCSPPSTRRSMRRN